MKAKISKTSKMPGLSYSLPAQECITGQKLRDVPGSTCSKCYALKGRYLFKNVTSARYHNLEHLNLALSNKKHRLDWIQQVSDAAGKSDFFRWHDSGDLQSMEHLELIVAVCNATPHTRHWLPTREHAIVQDYIMEHGSFPKNLVVRMSAHMIGKGLTVPESLAQHGVTSSTVGNGSGHVCPSSSQGNVCGDCRACWNRSVPSVDYIPH